MLNQIVLVGRIKNMLNDTIYLDVQRSTKNDNGEYEHDIVPVKLSGTLLEKTFEYCNVGDVVGVKGRVKSEVLKAALEIKLNILKDYERELESQDIPEYEEDFYKKVKLGIKETIDTLANLEQENVVVIAEKITFLSSRKVD